MMGDFIGNKECVTHHPACDCREAYFKKIESELAAVKAERDKLKEELKENLCDCVSYFCHCKNGKVNSVALSINAYMIRRLSEMGVIEIISESGHQVIGRWKKSEVKP
jgi:hypothetical protein